MMVIGAHRIKQGRVDIAVCESIYRMEALIPGSRTLMGLGSMHSLQEKRLADMLVDELSFLGQIPRGHLPQVRAYLIEQEPTLTRSAQRLIREPENESIRQELCSPHAMTVA